MSEKREPLTEEFINHLRSEFDRTGIGPQLFISHFGFDDLNHRLIYFWLNGEIKSAREGLADKILSALKTLPDNFYQRITPEMIEFINQEIDRTCKGPSAILRGNKKARELSVSSDKIKDILSGKTVRVRHDILDLILTLWKDAPDNDRTKPGYVEITSDIVQRIEEQIERTGVSSNLLLKGSVEAKEIGLTAPMIYSWGRGRVKEARAVHVELALKLWDDLPNKEDRPPRKYMSPGERAKEMHRNALLQDGPPVVYTEERKRKHIPFLSDIDLKKNPEYYKRLRAMRKEKGVGVRTLARLLPFPEWSNESRLSSILIGKYRFISKSEYEWFEKAYSMV